MTAQTGYDAFGNATNAAFPTRYQFTGREFDSFTGLQFSRARFYDPRLGRFISEDPIGFRGGVNWFAYTQNNPLNFIDPLGLSPTNCSSCPTQSKPKLWEKPEFSSGPYSEPNMFTNIEKGSFTQFWDDPLGTLVNAIPYYCYNYLAKPLLGDFGAARPGPNVFGRSGAGFPTGELMNTLELGPDLYNTTDTVDRRNQDINDAVRCASGNCSISPYQRGNGLGGKNNGWQPSSPQ